MYHFFDQAIAELNTTFKIGLPLVSEMVSENKFDITNVPNAYFLANAPSGSSSEIPTVKDVAECTDVTKLYYNAQDNLFYKYSSHTDSWEAYSSVYGVYVDNSLGRVLYTTVPMYAAAAAYWSPVDESRLDDFDLAIYLPEDWIILFLIPYVCFKFSVRDGNSGQLYNEEWVQGHQQLVNSYDVPNFVVLKDVCHLPAYKSVALQNMSNLNIKCLTRAVYASMKTPTAIRATYGGFYSAGGWEI
jgi:hypothetical protein